MIISDLEHSELLDETFTIRGSGLNIKLLSDLDAYLEELFLEIDLNAENTREFSTTSSTSERRTGTSVTTSALAGGDGYAVASSSVTYSY